MKTIILFTISIFSGMISIGQWTSTELPEGRFRMAVATLDTKAYFAGGESESGLAVSAVEIYDAVDEKWDSAIHLSVGRGHVGGVSAGTKIFFAGGVHMNSMQFYDEVDIWDTQTKEWAVRHLLFARFGVVAVSYDNKVLFAGGTNEGFSSVDLVEIYDIETDSWEYATLSDPRSAFAFAIVNDIAFFAGGSNNGTVSDRVDIYNFSNNTWSTDELSLARAFLTATVVGSKVFFAGGTTAQNESSDRVDIFDVENGTWDTAHLSQPRAFWDGNSGTVCGQRAYFVGGGEMDLNTYLYSNPYDVIDIFDADSYLWTVDHLNNPIMAHSVAGIDDQLIIAGGMSDLVILSTVNIFNDTNCIHTGIAPTPKPYGGQFSSVCYPNPFSGFATIEYELGHDAYVTVCICNQIGQLVAILVNGEQTSGIHQVCWNAEGLPDGLYIYRISCDGKGLSATGKMLKTE